MLQIDPQFRPSARTIRYRLDRIPFGEEVVASHTEFIVQIACRSLSCIVQFAMIVYTANPVIVISSYIILIFDSVVIILSLIDILPRNLL